MKDDTKAGLDAHAATGRRVGDFLTALLENNLWGAVSRADDENRADLVEIITYVYNELPGACWGSPNNVAAWRAAGGLEGIEKEQEAAARS